MRRWIKNIPTIGARSRNLPEIIDPIRDKDILPAIRDEYFADVSANNQTGNFNSQDLGQSKRRTIVDNVFWSLINKVNNLYSSGP